MSAIFDTIFTPITGPGGLQQVTLTNDFQLLRTVAPPPRGARGAWIQGAAGGVNTNNRFGFSMAARTGGNTPRLIWHGRQPLILTNEQQLGFLSLVQEDPGIAMIVNIQYFTGQVGTTR